MINEEFPFTPGLSLEQARESMARLRAQYKDQIAEAKNIENRLGVNRTYPGYLGKR